MLALWAFEWDAADWATQYLLGRVVTAAVESLVALRESAAGVPPRMAESLVALLVAAAGFPERGATSLAPVNTAEVA